MSGAKQAKPNVVTYGDHEIITPDSTKLRRLVRTNQHDDGDDPVVRAEAALSQISSEFAGWMDAECDRLDAARRKVRDIGFNEQTRQELFLAAHDLKGDSGTFGYPAVTPVADSLCRLLEHTPDSNRIPLPTIDQHVDAVRAIVREHAREDVAAMAATLTSRLRQVTDEFLIAENQGRPDVLSTITSPSLAPNEF